MDTRQALAQGGGDDRPDPNNFEELRRAADRLMHARQFERAAELEGVSVAVWLRKVGVRAATLALNKSGH